MTKQNKTPEALNKDHERLLALLKLWYARMLSAVFVSAILHVLFLKPHPTEVQRIYCGTTLTAMICGSAGYMIGKK